MNQQEFVQRYEEQWQVFETLLERLEKKTPRAGSRSDDPRIVEFPFLYRRICQQLALARDRDYAAHVIDRLNILVLRGHQHLYESRAGIWSRMLYVAVAKFPRRVRKEAGLFWIATALLYLPTFAIVTVVMSSPDMVYAILEPSQVDGFEEMYNPDSEHFGRTEERSSSTDAMMFGFYIRNNIGIAFRTFAGGLLYGLGSMFFLVFNGVYFGAVAGHLSNLGFTDPFFSFVIGHGAFELTAIVLAGMAGLKLGLALVSPGRMTRVRSLKEAARESVEIVYGMIAMLIIAAFLEAFWSSSTLVPYSVKYSVGAVLWLLVAAYFLLLGRTR